MAQAVGFWIVFGVAAFGWALAVQMRMVIAKVLRLAVAASHGDLHQDDIRVVVRSAPVELAPAGLPGNLCRVRDWLREAHPQAVKHLAKARRWSVILPVVILVVLSIGRFGLRVI